MVAIEASKRFLFRYCPRDIYRICTGSQHKWLIDKPKIHRSVFERIGKNVIPYAPTGIPETYQVVSTRKTPVEYETIDEKKMRIGKMQRAMKSIKQRTRLYYGFLIISAAFLASPIFLGCPGVAKYLNLPGEANHWLHTSLFNGLTFILPEFIGPWLIAWKNNPLFFYPAVLLFLIFLMTKMLLFKKTQASAADAWNILKSKN